MHYRQKADKSADTFVTRARTLAQKCQFTDEELTERLIALIIASTPPDALRNEPDSKPKGQRGGSTRPCWNHQKMNTSSFKPITEPHTFIPTITN